MTTHTSDEAAEKLVSFEKVSSNIVILKACIIFIAWTHLTRHDSPDVNVNLCSFSSLHEGGIYGDHADWGTLYVER